MINVVVASDENYAPHLETLLVSIGENNKYEERIKISIFDGGLSEGTKTWIKNLRNQYSNLSFDFIQMTEKDIENKIGGCVGRDRTLATYSRIFIPEIISAEKAVYLDVDAIIESDLRELYNLDLNGYAIAGVRDSNPISRHRNVGLKDSDAYINAGMILWNLDKCRKIHATEQLIQFVRDHNGQVDAMDQGTINGVFGVQGLTKIIHPKYNAFTSLFQLKSEEIRCIYGLKNYYTDKEIREAQSTPLFIHFTPNMTTRPWVKNCVHPYRKLYWKYREFTQFNQKMLSEDNRSIKMRTVGFVYRNLPHVFVYLSVLKSKFLNLVQR